jgi:hypothetical protein
MIGCPAMAENGRGEAKRRCASPHAGDGEPTAASERERISGLSARRSGRRKFLSALERADRLCAGQNHATPWSTLKQQMAVGRILR